MARRYASYLPGDGFADFNLVSTIGAGILGLSMIPFLWNVWITARKGKIVTLDDPWGYGRSLEWQLARRSLATTSPQCHAFVQSRQHSTYTTQKQPQLRLKLL